MMTLSVARPCLILLLFPLHPKREGDSVSSLLLRTTRPGTLRIHRQQNRLIFYSSRTALFFFPAASCFHKSLCFFS
uniref:Putative secreted protein n=1 Tax=Anopheles darlingi TaxID=43151 RepID=A0A2M4D9C1_ANODA